MMTSDDLDRIQDALAIRLPDDYRTLLTAYPSELGPAGPDYELLNDPGQLIAINREFREDGFFGMPWPARYYTFGGDGGGNAYFLDVQRDPSPVLYADHEVELYDERWPSLQAWLDEMIREQGEFEEEERQRMLRRAAKRWWQFWI